MKRYIIIAGETSGDNYGSQLIQSISEIYHDDVEFWGIGGKKMESAGLNELENINNISVIGFSEVIKKLPHLIQLRNRLSLFINELQPEHIILIDYPGFNLNLVKRIEKKIRVTYLISPQLWAWHSQRIKYIRKHVDMMLVIFPFEKEYYKKRDINVHYIGHPFLDENHNSNNELSKEKLGFNKHKKLIGVFPGSRKEELKRHLPIYLNAARELKKNHSNYEFAIGLAPIFTKNEIKVKYNVNDEIKIIDKNPLDLLSCCDAAIVTSGTISLESTFMNVPCVVAYRLSTLSWILSKILLKTKYISITNIISNKMIIPELIQRNVNVENIIKSLSDILGKKHLSIKKDLSTIKNMFLHKRDAIKNAAQLITSNDSKK